MKTQKEIEEKLIIMETQRDDSENPHYEVNNAKCEILNWVLGKNKED